MKVLIFQYLHSLIQNRRQQGSISHCPGSKCGFPQEASNICCSDTQNLSVVFILRLTLPADLPEYQASTYSHKAKVTARVCKRLTGPKQYRPYKSLQKELTIWHEIFAASNFVFGCISMILPDPFTVCFKFVQSPAKTAVSPRSSPLWTFRAQERRRLSGRNSMT